MKPRSGSLNGIANSSHICCAMGCARPIHPTLFMCTAHWRMLPEDYRQQYNTLARRVSTTPYHTLANRAQTKLAELQKLCIQFVAEQEGLLEKAG